MRNTTARYDDTMATNEKGFMFRKLQEAENYKQWNQDMIFALKDAKLWDHIMRSARRPTELKETKNDDEDRKERIYQRWKRIWDFNLDVRKTAAKISRICTDTVQKEFLTVKNSTEWDPKKLWDWLKRRYTLQNFASKWSSFDKFHGIRHSECKNVTEYMSRIKDASAKIDDLKISISEAVVIHALNNLNSHLWPYLAILSYDTRKKKSSRHLVNWQTLGKMKKCVFQTKIEE